MNPKVNLRPRNISRISKIMDKKVKTKTPKWWQICFLILTIIFTLSLIGNLIFTYLNYKRINGNVNMFIRFYNGTEVMRNIPRGTEVENYVKEKTTVNVALSVLLAVVSIVSIVGLLMRKVWMQITFFATAIICCFINGLVILGFKQYFGNPTNWHHIIILSLAGLVIIALLTKRFFKTKQYDFAIPLRLKQDIISNKTMQ